MNDDDDHRGYDPSPVNPLPPVVLVLFLVIFGVETVLAAAEAGLVGGPGGVGWRLGLARDYGFSPQILDWMIANGRWPLEHLLRPFTYPFLHLGFTHMLIAGVILLAMGKFVGEAFGSVAAALIFFMSGAVGAVIYGALTPDEVWLLGAYPGTYGLIGGFTYVLWRRYEALGEQQVRAFSLIGVLMAIQLIWGLAFGTDYTWIAELSGFATGFGLSVVIGPGGWRGVLNRLRRD